MKRSADARDAAAVEVTVRLVSARRNGEVHVQGSVHAGDGTVPFNGWLDLLDSLERVAERALDDGDDGDTDQGEGHGG